MSQWEAIKARGLYESINGYYTQFPVEVRAVLASWLEPIVFESNLDPDNVEHTEYLVGFRDEMLRQLQLFVNGILGNNDQSIWYRQTLTERYHLIAEQYQNDPATLFRRIRNCLTQEKQHLQQSIAGVSSQSNQQTISQQLPNTFLTLKNRLNFGVPCRLLDIKTKLGRMADVIVELGSNRESANEIQSLMNTAVLQQNGIEFRAELNERMQVAQTLHHQKNQEFKGLMVQLLKEIKALLDELNTVYGLVIAELNVWKTEQRKSFNGYQVNKNLDNIEELAKLIAQAVVDTSKELKEADGLQNNVIIHTNGQYPEDIKKCHEFLASEINKLLQLLVTKMWVVERQPHQVLRSKTTPIKPGIKLRLLVGETLNRNETCMVKVFLLNEDEARKLQDPNYVPESTVQLQQNKQMMCLDTKTNTFSVEFTGITFSAKIPRRSKRNLKSDEGKTYQFVAEEKWCFYFTSEFNALDQKFLLSTVSCPVSITCHPNQDASAWGTIIWDNAFTYDLQEPFKVPKEVDCEELLDNLDKKFHYITGRGLTDRNRNAIRTKLLRNEPTNGLVSWDLFFTKPLDGIKHPKSNKPVSFWEWIFAIMKLCEETNDSKKKKENLHFQKFWKDGNIVGFIPRDEMENVLKQSKDQGTFLFRFSETILGAVTLIWCSNNREIQKYEPYTLEELKQISLADRILDKSHLQYLYPANNIIDKHLTLTGVHRGNILKQDVFSQSKQNVSKSELLRGYILRRVNEVELADTLTADTIMMRSRNDSTTSESSAWLSQSPYSQQSVSTPGSSKALGFSSSGPSSVETPNMFTFGSQPHGSSGGQDFELGPDFNSDGGFPDLSLSTQMEESVSNFDETLMAYDW